MKIVYAKRAARHFIGGKLLLSVICLLLLPIEQAGFSTTNESPRQGKPPSQENDAARIIKKTQPSNNQPPSSQPDKTQKTKRPTKSKTSTAKEKEKIAGSTAQAGNGASGPNKPATQPPKAETRVGSILINLEFFDSDMTVLIDDEKPPAPLISSEETIELRDIPLGSHILSITHPAIKEVRRKVALNVEGEILYVNLRFDLVAGILTILSEPGADIFVDGKKERVVPESGEVVVVVPRGVRKIKAEKPGYKSSEIERDFGVEAFVLNLQLARKP